jgi:hypothetical protein
MATVNPARGKYRVSTEALGIPSTADVYADDAVSAAFLAGLNSDGMVVNGHADFTTDTTRNSAHDMISVSAERIGDAPGRSDGDILDVILALLTV